MPRLTSIFSSSTTASSPSFSVAFLTSFWLLSAAIPTTTRAFTTTGNIFTAPFASRAALFPNIRSFPAIMSARRASPRKKTVTDFFVAGASASSSVVSNSTLCSDNKKKLKKTVASPVKPTGIPSSNTATASVVSSSSVSLSTSSSLLEEWVSHTDASFHRFPPDEASQIRQALLDWYRENRRKLPWRGDPPPYEGSTAGTNTNGNRKKKANETTIVVKDYNKDATKQYQQSAYGTWVSEIMLQQTRVEAVIPYWLKWMEAFPTIQALADATEEQVNAHWAGLGFYRRARLLHSAAKHVSNNCTNGQLPETVAELESIPGIGPYTAAAIASISFGVAVPVVDGNVCRVLSRLRGVANHIKAPIFKDKMAWELAGQIVGDVGEDAGDVNQAMMELGATFCAPSGTGIDDNDPLKYFYMSTKLGAAYFREITLEPSSSKTRKELEDIITIATSTAEQMAPMKDKPAMCALCDANGISTVLEQLAESIEDQTMRDGDDSNDIMDAAKRCGHGVLPIAPPKLTKREEVLAVAVISTTVRPEKTKTSKKKDSNDNTYWLLVKRPKKGLLAGQWEFPSVCVWNSDADTKTAGVKRKAPSSPAPKKKGNMIEVPKIGPSVRQKALDKLMDDILLNNKIFQCNLKDSGKLAKLKGSPLEHVFSHVRHTMWIDYASVSPTTGEASILKPIDWVSSNEREVKWMRESDMKQAGVTSGVKKILKAVQEEQQNSSKKQGFFQPKVKKKM